MQVLFLIDSSGCPYIHFSGLIATATASILRAVSVHWFCFTTACA
jgi:hypothetical protein